jgi:maltose alpha-D-glucosyltransferase/alpha-amylase
MWEWYAPQRRMRRNIGIRRRLAPLLDNNPDKIMLANRVLFSLPGCPIIYYGDEIGMGDNIWLKDRDGVRTPMQWDDTPFAGFTAWDAVSAYYLPTEEGEFSYKKVNVARQKKNPNSLLNRMRELIALRKAHPAFALGTLEFIDVENPPVLAFLRSYQEQTIIVVHNFSPEEVKARLLVEGYEDRTPINILDPSSDGLKVKKRGYKVTLPGYGSQWLLLQG